MKSKREQSCWPRVAVLIWASLWMLAAPLFHVHPDVDHHHGEAGHTHNGTIHAVWSPDLDCEFDSHEGHADTVSGPAQFAHSGDSHPEIGLALLNDSSDRKSLKPFFTQALGFLSATGSDTESSLRIHRAISSLPSAHLPVWTNSSRAPPSLLV
ncbi:MAG: hypothetical protein WBK08_11730 [Nitrospira sp.]